ncbi:MAG: serine hydrolase domain-containing protein [Thermoplasmata archaeon]
MERDDQETFERISEFADLSMWRQGLPGMVLGVTDRERTVFRSAKGLSEVASGRPMDLDALFQIGSVSKSFTCVALLQLAERGVIDLRAPVREYLPWFSVKSRYSDITLHHLMTHTAGIMLGSDATPTAWTEVWDLRESEATCEPGTHFHYSNSGYKALGLVLETVSGKTYSEILREGIFDVAGMRSTEAVITNSIRKRLAVAHLPTEDDRPYQRGADLSPAPWFEGDTADGSICAPLEDMLAYMRVLLNRGQGPWGQVLSSDSFKRMTTPYIEPDDMVHLGGYGYGLNIETTDGHTRIGHTGGMVGHQTAMLMDMDSGVGAMVMVNGPGSPEEIAKFAVESMVVSTDGGKRLEVPRREEAFRFRNAPDYAGDYGGPSGALSVADREGTLHITRDGHESRLEPLFGEAFLSDAPGLELFPLEFERIEGHVVRIHHGERTYARDGSRTASVAPSKADGVRVDGHYRSHNPWLSNFRVVKRMDGLVFALPNEPSLPMVPLGDNLFRIGSDPRSPERIEFSCVIGGVATCATLAGGGRYGRTFTP